MTPSHTWLTPAVSLTELSLSRPRGARAPGLGLVTGTSLLLCSLSGPARPSDLEVSPSCSLSAGDGQAGPRDAGRQRPWAFGRGRWVIAAVRCSGRCPDGLGRRPPTHRLRRVRSDLGHGGLLARSGRSESRCRNCVSLTAEGGAGGRGQAGRGAGPGRPGGGAWGWRLSGHQDIRRDLAPQPGPWAVKPGKALKRGL